MQLSDVYLAGYCHILCQPLCLEPWIVARDKQEIRNQYLGSYGISVEYAVIPSSPFAALIGWHLPASNSLPVLIRASQKRLVGSLPQLPQFWS